MSTDTTDTSATDYFNLQPGTSPDAMVMRGNNYPYIIAYGSSKREISRFYIEVEKHVMMVIYY